MHTRCPLARSGVHWLEEDWYTDTITVIEKIVTASIAELAVAKNIPLVIGTTGHTAEEKKQILDTIAGKIAVVWAGNYSVGVNTVTLTLT